MSLSKFSNLFKNHEGFFKDENNVVWAKRYLRNFHIFKNFQVREDDVFVCAFPKSGSTWGQEMVWCIVNNFDIEKALKTPVGIRCPLLERGVEHLPDNLPGYPMSFYDNLDSQLSPRVFKSLLPHQYLPEGVRSGKYGKIIYFARDPRDVVVSLFHFLGIAEGYTGSLEQCIEAFLHDNVERTPYWDHIRGYRDLSSISNTDPGKRNVLFIMYENLVKNLGCEIEKICTFLNKPSPPLHTMEELKTHLSFASMKNNPNVNREDWINSRKQLFFGKMEVPGKFMRKGKIGGWRDEIDANQVKLLNDWMKTKGIQLWE